MRYFDSLRIAPWAPKFSWVETEEKSAHQINSFHEDYPLRVESTKELIYAVYEGVESIGLVLPNDVLKIKSILLKWVHSFVFQGTGIQGQWREVNVTIGLHTPPKYQLVPKFMNELEARTEVQKLGDLLNWYVDFESCHPFQDGNGRVGGIMVAAVSHYMYPLKGYLTPKQ